MVSKQRDVLRMRNSFKDADKEPHINIHLYSSSESVRNFELRYQTRFSQEYITTICLRHHWALTKDEAELLQNTSP